MDLVTFAEILQECGLQRRGLYPLLRSYVIPPQPKRWN